MNNNMETLPLSALITSKANPRKRVFDIEGLAASIRQDGLLQNLVVEPSGKKGQYRIISGERRYRALMLLAGRGELPGDYAVKVEIRENLSKDDALRIALVENLQRANLSPLEEMAALTKLIHKRVTLDEIAAQAGLSATTIKRRLALNGLCREAKKALKDGEINLSQAEALTLGTHEAQGAMLEEIISGRYPYTAEEIRAAFLDERPVVANAVFPVEQYKGSIITDLFGDEEASYFDDAEQFFELQKRAVELLADDYRKFAAWVEITSGYLIPDWQYDEAEDGEPSGVLINLSPSGKVEVKSGLKKSGIDEDTAAEIAENPAAPLKPKAVYAAPLRRYIGHHKSAAIQEMLLADPRKAKEIAAVKALIDLEPHCCLKALAQEDEPQKAHGVMESQARLFLRWLGIEVADDDLAWNQLPRPCYEDVQLYEAVKALSDHELDELHTLLAALAFGQKDCERLDTGDTLFNRVARDLGVDMKNHWRPDRSFFERRNREQLAGIGKECGYSVGRSMIGGYKRSELVSGLLKHFATAFSAEKPSAAQEKARNWLPEVMQFPAIDPDAAHGHEDEPAEDAIDEAA